jgi:hypothetical protein
MKEYGRTGAITGKITYKERHIKLHIIVQHQQDKHLQPVDTD